MTDPRVVLVAALVIWCVRPGVRATRGWSRSARIRVGNADVIRELRRRYGPIPGRLALLAAAAVVGVVAPLVAGLFVVIAAVTWMRREPRHARDRQLEVERTLPHMIDLLSLVVSAGVAPRRALAMVVPRCPIPHRQAWADVIARIDAGQGLSEALQPLIASLGPPVRPLVSALLAAERDGVALVPALERCSADAHRRQRVRAEEAARRIPVLMLFPLVCCVLPAFGLLTIVPLLVGSVSDIQLPS